MAGTAGKVGSERAHFPAVDLEPPPVSRRRRLVAAAVCLVAAALVAFGVTLVVTGSGRGSGGKRTATVFGAELSGAVVVFTATDHLVLARPDGTHLVPLDSLGAFGGGTPVVSPDRTLIATSDATIIAISAGTLKIRQTTVSLGSSQVLATPGAFADHDQAVIALTEGQFGAQTATPGLQVISLSTGQAVSLGTVGHAAGDPEQVGAFVSVPGPEVGAATAQVLPPDTSVELRDAGAKPVTLVTAAQAAGDVGMDPTTPVDLVPMPDGAGDKVAIEVAPADGGPAGIVLVGRSGAVLAEVSSGLGPLGGSLISWSPDNSTIAYLTPGSDGTEIATLTFGGQASTRTIPTGGAPPGECLWSPDGSELLCAGSGSTGVRLTWYLVPAGPGPIARLDAPGWPIVWLPAAHSGGGA